MGWGWNQGSGLGAASSPNGTTQTIVSVAADGVYFTVDQNFINNPVVALDSVPIPSSEIVALNGSVQTADIGYTVVGNTITILPTVGLNLNDGIVIKYLFRS